MGCEQRSRENPNQERETFVYLKEIFRYDVVKLWIGHLIVHVGLAFIIKKSNLIEFFLKATEDFLLKFVPKALKW